MFCQECGKELKAGADFCISCGKAVNKSNTPIVSVPKNKSNFNKVMGIIFVSFAGLFLLISIIFMGVASEYENIVYDCAYGSYCGSDTSYQFLGCMVLAGTFFISAIILSVSAALMNKKTCNCGNNCDCGSDCNCDK